LFSIDFFELELRAKSLKEKRRERGEAFDVEVAFIFDGFF
jgi:hypothetical protein